MFSFDQSLCSLVFGLFVFAHTTFVITVLFLFCLCLFLFLPLEGAYD